MSTALEENVFQIRQDAALTELRTEFSEYFNAIDQHPRALVGKSVPSMFGEGNETLRDSQDAADWQEAVKSVLVRELQARTSSALEGDQEWLSVLHGSIDLFQGNPDLVPGTRQFDAELANEFAKLAKPYERRAEGKLIGYTIPVQPLVQQVRAGLVARRAAADAAKAAAPAAAPKAGSGRPGKANPAPAPAAPPEGPQAGIQSKAGASSNADASDFSSLFGTLGAAYRDIQI